MIGLCVHIGIGPVQVINHTDVSIDHRKEEQMKLCVRVVRNDVGGYTAQCPSLPGCTVHATTKQEACERLDEAIRGYIAAVNNFVPEHLDHEVVEI